VSERDELRSLIDGCRAVVEDLHFGKAVEWKHKNGGFIVGYTPVYFPREIVWGMGGLAVGIHGGGPYKEVIKGDAYYQSYICHIPRSIVEMLLDGHFREFDGFVFPAICDVMRNLSGVFRLTGVDMVIKYLDFPQSLETPHISMEFYREEIMDFVRKMENKTGKKLSIEKVKEGIALYNRNRALVRRLYELRSKVPWCMEFADLYFVVRAGLVMSPDEHNAILERIIELVERFPLGKPEDKIRVIVVGAFCEQPPPGLIRSIEMSGCYVVDDDMLLGGRWFSQAIDPDADDPIDALITAYLNDYPPTSCVYDGVHPKEKRVVEMAKSRGVDGVILCAPNFCDPALLDQPIIMRGLTENGIRYVSVKYSEVTSQYKPIKEEVGSFSDSIKLGEALSLVEEREKEKV